MDALEEYLYLRVKPVIESWRDDAAYAISFYTEANSACQYEGGDNACGFSIGYATEADICPGGDPGEERWGMLAAIRRRETFILRPNESAAPETPDRHDPGMETLFARYAERGIGPGGWQSGGAAGRCELKAATARVARRLQREGVVSRAFRGPLPIVVHESDFVESTMELTACANPNGEAEAFLAYAADLLEEARESRRRHAGEAAKPGPLGPEETAGSCNVSVHLWKDMLLRTIERMRASEKYRLRPEKWERDLLALEEQFRKLEGMLGNQ